MEKVAGENILLISHTFPPYPGIGGRRWAKFAKNLARSGYTIHVICARNPFTYQSLWTDDVADKKIVVYALTDHYPKALMVKPERFIDKVNYRLSLFYVKLFSKGTPYDRALFWNKPAFILAEELVNKFQIKNLIVSSAPFSCAYEATKLKKKLGGLNLMIDFRDPWTWGDGYGFPLLKASRRQFEEQMEYKTMEGADRIFVPVDVMANHLKGKYPSFSNKITVLPHAFDASEVSQKSAAPKTGKNLVFYGTLYEEIGPYFEEIIVALKKAEFPVQLHIYSDTNAYSGLFAKAGLLNTSVFFHEMLPTKQLFKKIAVADYVLLIHPDRGVDNISTKFYEIIYSGTPVIYLSKPGLTSRFVEDCRIGYYLQLGEIAERFCNVIAKNEAYNPQFDVADYSFESITNKLIENYFQHDRQK